MLTTLFTTWHKLPLVLTRITSAMIIFIIFWISALITCSLVKRISLKEYNPIIEFLGKLARNIILIIGLVCALGTAGVNVTALVASLGLVSFSAGYALKDMLSNFIAGFMIMLNGTVKPGDHISISTFEGEVQYISIRYTVLTAKNKQVYIPNGIFTTSPLTIIDKGVN